MSSDLFVSKMQVLNAKEIACAEEGKASYEIQWTIPNWRQVRTDVSLVKNQKAVFETGSQSSQMIQTKWLVGLKDAPNPDSIPWAKVYWQLLDIKGSGAHIGKLDAKVCTTLCRAQGTRDIEDERNVEVSLGEIIEENGEFLDIGTACRVYDNVFINSNGAIEYKLVLTFKTPDIDSSSPTHSKKLKLEQFSKRSRDQLHQNLVALLHEDSFSDGDLRIITRDRVELVGHQSILKVQCPVFAAMLNSNLSETQTGIVKVDDISGKTMKALLHYLYTGDLLDGWSDEDTIVEFTYAAGKYQVTQVLELLDDLFGRGALNEVSNVDVQLLNLTGKLAMKNAEKRLLQQIIGKVSAAKKSEDLFQLFGCDGEEISRKAEMLAGEQVRESKVLEIMDYAFRSTANLPEDLSDRALTLLAFVHRSGSLKTLEQVLLKRFAKIANKFKSAKELFAFFGEGK